MEDQVKPFGIALKEGERLLAPTRRPDGTLRKPIKIRAGYTPQDEVAIYQSKGTLLKKSTPDVPPGCDPEFDAKPKSKSAKRNERKKEKRQQEATLVSTTLDQGQSAVESTKGGENIIVEEVAHELEDADSLANQITRLAVSFESAGPLTREPAEGLNLGGPADIDKRIRALKKKIRLTEALDNDGNNLKPEQLEKLAKLEGWRDELKELEEQKIGAP